MRRVVYTLVALFFGGILGAGWYAYDRGFTKKWRSFVASEFRKRGVEMSLRQLALEPFRGIVARDVKIYEGRDRHRTLAVVNEVLLVINYANFFQKKPFIDALDLHEARLSLPLDPRTPRGAAVEIKNLSGRLLLPPQQIHLSRLDADVYGVHVSASGLLIHPQAFQSGSNATSRGSLVLAERIIEELKSLRFDGPAPQLKLRFSGDLADPGRIFIEGTLVAGPVHHDKWGLDRLQLAAAYRDGVLDLQEFTASDPKGGLEAHGHWRAESGRVDVRVRSSLAGRTLFGLLRVGAPWTGCVFGAPPLIELTADGNLGESLSLRVVSRVLVERFSYNGMAFDKLGADVSWQDGCWSARDVELLHRSGKLHADFLQLPGAFRGRVESSIEANVLTPSLPAGFGGLFGQFNFVDTPSVQLELSGPDADMQLCTAVGVLRAERASFRNGPVERLNVSVNWAGGEWRIQAAR